ncbi:AraC family transcriptional regulator (plasmid) [Comamonadaceae bacterium OTU4NAUVB1]|nr:AraC family transcriptional regulator [Comamonadaceae bacterium OTU4NAUVB1]
MNQLSQPTEPTVCPAGGTRRVSVRCDDVEQAQLFLSKEYVPVRVTSHQQRLFDFEATVAFCGGVGFSSASSRSGIQLDFEECFDGYGMSLPLAGSMSLGVGTKDRVSSRPQSGLMMDSRTVESVGLSSHSAWHRIALSSDELHAHMALLTQRPMRHRVRFEPHFSHECGAAALMFGISRSIIEGVRGHAPLLAAPSAIVSLKEAVLSLFVEAMPHDHSDHLRRPVALPAPRHVRRAIDFMHANALQPLRLADIAQAAQTSARSLQMAFRHFRDMTPMEYLRRLRLDGARDELIHCPPGASVAQIAYRWGFAHHGMFAKRYAKAFGESPSATLRRHRKD